MSGSFGRGQNGSGGGGGGGRSGGRGNGAGGQSKSKSHKRQNNDNLPPGMKRVRLHLCGYSTVNRQRSGGSSGGSSSGNGHHSSKPKGLERSPSGNLGAAGSGNDSDNGKSEAKPPPPRRRAWLSEREEQMELSNVRYPPSAASARLLKQLADFNPSGKDDAARNALLPNEHDAKERGEQWRLPEGGCPADLLRAQQEAAKAAAAASGSSGGGGGPANWSSTSGRGGLSDFAQDFYASHQSGLPMTKSASTVRGAGALLALDDNDGLGGSGGRLQHDSLGAPLGGALGGALGGGLASLGGALGDSTFHDAMLMPPPSSLPSSPKASTSSGNDNRGQKRPLLGPDGASLVGGTDLRRDASLNAIDALSIMGGFGSGPATHGQSPLSSPKQMRGGGGGGSGVARRTSRESSDGGYGPGGGVSSGDQVNAMHLLDESSLNGSENAEDAAGGAHLASRLSSFDSSKLGELSDKGDPTRSLDMYDAADR